MNSTSTTTTKILPHAAFEIMTPDEVAETIDGVYSAPNGLYEALWACVSDYDESYKENIEDMGPHDVIGLNSVADFWDRFSPAHQTKLNELLQAHDAWINELVNKTR